MTKIALSVTTCRRPMPFKRAWNSFKLHCLDTHLIDKYYVVDDFSPKDDLRHMKKTAPEATFLTKKPHEKGHAGSLNVILRELYEKDFDYLIFLEDDFFFIQDDNYITKCIDLLKKYDELSQVVFNKNYHETNTFFENDRVVLSGEEIRNEKGELECLRHEWKGFVNSDGWKSFMSQHPGKVSHAHWFGFTLNPGIWNLKKIKHVGYFTPSDSFEWFFAERCWIQGYRTAFLPDVNCIHLGKLRPSMKEVPDQVNAMYDRYGINMNTLGSGTSAYDLNSTKR